EAVAGRSTISRAYPAHRAAARPPHTGSVSAGRVNAARSRSLDADAPRRSVNPAIVASLGAAQREAGCTAVMNGLTEPFMIPYALALGATSFQAGLLSSVRNLLLSLVQLGSAD